MATIRNYGVGTGWSETSVTGKKSTFESDEKIFAEHVWDDVEANDTFKIRFTKWNGTIWKTLVDKIWTNSAGYSSIYHETWIKGYGTGDYKVFFYRNNVIYANTSFTVREEEAPPEPKPSPEYPKTVSRGAYSFEARNSEEEKQLKELLGIDPSGLPLDEWLAPKGKDDLNYWYTYWTNIFWTRSMATAIKFIQEKWAEYAKKLEEEEPPEVPWYEKALDFLKVIIPINFTLWPPAQVSPLLKLIQDGIIKKADREGFDKPDWLWETGLAILFLDLEDFSDESIIMGTVPITPAGNILSLMKSKGFLKALDVMKANPLKYANDFAKLSPKTASQILKGMKKDQLAGLATNVFKASWDEALIKTAPAWKRAMFAAGKHKWKGFFGLISLGGLIMGTDLWGNWAIIDNLQFMSGRDADDVLAAYENGTMSKEDALAELNQMLDIVKAGETKVKTSAGWNVMQIIFAPLWDELSTLTREKLERAIEKLEEIEVVVELEEEKWERIRAEADARREAEGKAEAEYYKRIVEEAEARKATARIEEAEYYEKIRIEAEERAAARKIEEEEYWATIQEQAGIAEADATIAAEEYWAGVEAEKKARLEEERLYWESRLAGPKKATITITSEPIGADVYIDGEFKWVTTPYTILLPIGDHVIRIQKDGYYPVETVIEVEEEEVTTIPFILEVIPAEDIPPEPYIPQSYYYPTYKPSVPYVPAAVTTPTAEVPSLEYEFLYPEKKPWFPYEEPAPAVEKELLINIETTGVKPWESRIYSIAFQDLSTPGAEPIVLTNNSEENLINDFLGIFDSIAPAKLLGFKLTFDHRFIFAKMMLYRVPNKAFKNIEMLDVKQIMDQVQEKFVYFPSKIGTLDNWGKMLLGKGKLGTQELMLRKYISGDYEYVKAFQLRQLEITKGIYDLSRFVGLESFSTPISSIPAEISSPSPILPEAPLSTLQTKKCPNCLAEQPIGAAICDICGTKI